MHSIALAMTTAAVLAFSSAASRPDLADAAGQSALPVEVGSRRPARFRQHDEARDGSARGKTDQDRRGVRARLQPVSGSQGSLHQRQPLFNIYTKPALTTPNARQGRSWSLPSSARSAPSSTPSPTRCGAILLQLLQARRDRHASGFKKLGVENVGSLMTRGVLIDVAGLKGVDCCRTPTSSRRTISSRLSQKQTKNFSPATRSYPHGWSKLMGKGIALGSVSPGIGVAAGLWLVGQEPMMIAADNCCVEVRPSEPAQPADPCHDADPARHLPDREPGVGGAGGGACLRIRLHRTTA